MYLLAICVCSLSLSAHVSSLTYLSSPISTTLVSLLMVQEATNCLKGPCAHRAGPPLSVGHQAGRFSSLGLLLIRTTSPGSLFSSS